jgi:uncharacterized protein
MKTKQQLPSPAQAWWTDPWRWLIVAGPMIVIVAGLITMGFAIHGADIVVDHQRNYQHGPEKSQAQAVDPSLKPAKQARNDAATAAVAK